MIGMLPILSQLFLKLCNFLLVLLDLGLIFVLDLQAIVDRCLFCRKCQVPIKKGLLEDICFLSQLLLDSFVLATMCLTLP